MPRAPTLLLMLLMLPFLGMLTSVGVYIALATGTQNFGGNLTLHALCAGTGAIIASAVGFTILNNRKESSNMLGFGKKRELVDGNLALVNKFNETGEEVELHQETVLPQEAPQKAEPEYEVKPQIATHQPVQSQEAFAPTKTPGIAGRDMAKTAEEIIAAMAQLLQGFKTTESSVWENISSNAREIQEAFLELEAMHENAAEAARRAREAASNIFTAIEGRQ